MTMDKAPEQGSSKHAIESKEARIERLERQVGEAYEALFEAPRHISDDKSVTKAFYVLKDVRKLLEDIKKGSL